MKSRTTRKTVMFAAPFNLRGCDETLDPGTYLVETAEESIEGPTVRAYRPKQTLIHLHAFLGRPGTSRILSVSGKELDAASRNGRMPYESEPMRLRFGEADNGADLSALDRADDEGMTRGA